MAVRGKIEFYKLATARYIAAGAGIKWGRKNCDGLFSVEVILITFKQ